MKPVTLALASGLLLGSGCARADGPVEYVCHV